MLRDGQWHETMSSQRQAGRSRSSGSDIDINTEIEDDEQLETIEEIVAAPHTRENILRYLYWEKNMTQPEIGERYGVSDKAISRWMKKRGIETRESGGHHTGVSIKNTNGRNKLVVNDEEDRYEWPLSNINLLVKRSLGELINENEEGYSLSKLDAHHRIPVYTPDDGSGGISIDSPNNLDGLPTWFHLGPAHDSDNPIYTYDDPAELNWPSTDETGVEPREGTVMTLELDDDEITDSDESGADGNNDE